MKKQVRIALIACSFLFATNANSQVSILPFAASLDTFGIITGTTLDSPNADDISYQNIPIGFNFSLGGVMHNKMSVNTNGYIELDSTGTGSFVNILGGSRNNIVAAFAADLIHHAGNASLQYVTLGSSPNQVTIIQWLHYSYFGGQAGDVSFQIQLFESSNCITFVYGANNYAGNIFHTQIGIRGDTISDYIVLGDTSCNWANAYPFSGINTSFPVSLSCNMPPGFAYNFGSCGNKGGANFGYITGKVFNDLNGNGVRDSIEPGIKNHVVNIVPGNYYVSSDVNGDYAFFFSDSTLTYSLSTGGITYWNQTNVPIVLSVNPATQSCSGLNFGFQIIPNIHEVSIHCPNWGAKPGQPEPMPISYNNNGTSTENDTITFVMDSLYSFISSNPAPTSVNGQTIQWAYSSLAPNSWGNIMLHILPSANAVLGNYLNSTLTIGPLNDTIPTNNVLNLHQLISNAWDPNEKLAEPNGMIAAGTEINYTIHFQNTGNAAAANVTVKDMLDATTLDLLSFKLTGSSHPVNFVMDGNGNAAFTFYNIQLPDSGSDFAGSNGYVTFSVNSRTSLAPLTAINNTAGIIFDSNIPVITNTTGDTILNPLAVNNHDMLVYQIGVFPNPATESVAFIFSNDKKESGELRITTLDGKLVLRKKHITSSQTIDISHLSPGIYICTIDSNKGIKEVKLVKE